MEEETEEKKQNGDTNCPRCGLRSYDEECANCGTPIAKKKDEDEEEYDWREHRR